MKKTVLKNIAFIIVISFIIVIVFAFGKKASAQTLTSDRAYQDYQYNLTIYNQAYSDYQDAKNIYLQGGKTLPQKDDATKKTYTMLVDRDQMMVTYLTALRAKISEQTGLPDDYKNAILGKIDAEVNFYSYHKTQYHASDSLDQLFSSNSQSQAQYKNTTSFIVDEALFDIGLGEEAGIRIAQEQIYTDLKNYINSGVAAGKLSLDPFNHWFTDIDATDSQLVQNDGTGKVQIQKMYSQTFALQESFTSSIGTLASSLTSLSRMNEFLTEVVNYIQNQQ